MSDIIKIEHLNKCFGDVKAVNDLSFRVKKGELFAFLGVNGAGKSTTISIICGQLRKDSGNVWIKDKEADRAGSETKRLLGVVFQDSVLDKPLTVKENLKSRAALYGIPFFSICYVFFGINITTIGYYMSIEKSRLATIFTVLRGIILPVICFFLLPLWLGVKGIWLAVAVAEFITFAVICINATCKRI